MLVQALSTGQAEVDEAQKLMLHGHPSKQRIFSVSAVGRPKMAPSWLMLAPSRAKLTLLGASGAASGLLGRSWHLWGCPWGGPGRLLVRSWRLLGRSWAELGPRLAALGPLLGPPGRLLGPLGLLLAATTRF